ncbi:MAG: 2Fe-2S iron-sulfur cluster binding domain-containing protein, partial [Deltaproteobacteria bacterium]|nr:2Fe-2S iron-sulfur cluster binding domain-containing protein [Deltaproteobacteria bacterium]
MTVKFTINGVQVEAEEGSNVLDTARRYGIEVPSLCHHEAVTPYGACRVCLVEIDKGGRKKITTSCNYEVL